MSNAGIPGRASDFLHNSGGNPSATPISPTVAKPGEVILSPEAVAVLKKMDILRLERNDKRDERRKAKEENVSEDEAEELTPYIMVVPSGEALGANVIPEVIPTPTLLFDDAAAARNSFQANDNSIPAAITFLAKNGISPPLTLFLPASLARIRSSNIKTVKHGTGESTKVTVIDISDFPDEMALDQATWCTCYNTFLTFMESVAGTQVFQGFASHFNNVLSNPDFAQRVVTPYQPAGWATALRDCNLLERYPNLVHDLSFGSPIGNPPTPTFTFIPPNMPSVELNPAFLDNYLTTEVSAGRMAGPLTVDEAHAFFGSHFRTAPLGLVEKEPGLGKWRMVQNHSVLTPLVTRQTHGWTRRTFWFGGILAPIWPTLSRRLHQGHRLRVLIKLMPSDVAGFNLARSYFPFRPLYFRKCTGNGGSVEYSYAYDLNTIVSISEPLGIVWNDLADKGHDFGFITEYTGFTFDLANKRVYLSEKKRTKYLAKVTRFLSTATSGKIKLPAMRSIHGTLQHLTFVYRNGRSFLPSLTQSKC
ncbi:hypothetical protein R3P38DRAFT_3284480 [Favolaschia claudopus]|uniref:Capsid protein n=1 Tax=Favolaschia claudopus TaxID=2862362 RepID=A0AAW0A6N3_9AGAR